MPSLIDEQSCPLHISLEREFSSIETLLRVGDFVRQNDRERKWREIIVKVL
jgi:hypothetical protein